MKRSMILLAVAGVVLVGLAGLLLFSLPGGEEEETPPEDDPAASAPRPAPDPGPGPPPRLPPPAGRVERHAEAPAPGLPAPGAPDARASSRRTRLEDENARRVARAAKAAHGARLKQLELYRSSLATLDSRVAELRASLKRLEASGNAAPEAVAQARRQIQQLLDSAPHSRAHMQRLERELAEAQKKDEKK